MSGNPYAKVVEDFWVPAVCLANNIYNDPEEALGCPTQEDQGPTGSSGS